MIREKVKQYSSFVRVKQIVVRNYLGLKVNIWYFFIRTNANGVINKVLF